MKAFLVCGYSFWIAWLWKICFSAILLIILLFTVATASEKWQGVDKAVVENIAKEHGREAKASLIDTDKGDLLLFVFLLAGAAGGFAAGYYWRVLISERRVDDKNK